MKRATTFVDFTVKCYGLYHSSLALPDEFTDENGKVTVADDEVLTFVRAHLPEANVKDLEFLEDLEDITESTQSEDIRGFTTKSPYMSSSDFLRDIKDEILSDPRAAGARAEIYGPFGLRAYSSLYLVKDGNTIAGLTVEMGPEDEILYETGRKNGNRFSLRTLDAMNGLDMEALPLPKDIGEIKKIMFKEECHER